MKHIETIGRVSYGGKCAYCGAPYNCDTGVRHLCEYDKGIVEPFNLCMVCSREIKNKGWL